MQAHRIVQTCFDMAGTIGGCTVKITHLNGDRLCTALEVRTNGGYKNTELKLLRRLNTDYAVGTDHEGTQIQSSAAAVGRNEVLVGSYDHFYSFNKFIFGENGHFQTTARISHSGCIQVGTEAYHMTILGIICLQTFETGLRILEYASTLAQSDGGLGGQLTLIPGSVFIFSYVAVFGGNITKSQITPINILTHFSFLLICRTFQGGITLIIPYYNTLKTKVQ